MPDHSSPLWAAIPSGTWVKSKMDGEDIQTAIDRAGFDGAAAMAGLYPGYQLHRLVPGSVYDKLGDSALASTTKNTLKVVDSVNPGIIDATFKGTAESTPGIGAKLLQSRRGKTKLLAALAGGAGAATTGAVAGDAVFDRLLDSGDLSDGARAAVDIASKAGVGAGIGSTAGWVPDKVLGRLAKLKVSKGTLGSLVGAGAGAAYSGIKQLLNKEANMSYAMLKKATGDRHSTSALALVPILGPSFKSLRDGDTPQQASTRSVLDAIGSVGGATTGATAAGLLRHKVPQVNIPLMNKVIKAPGLLKTLGIGALVGHGVGSLTADSALDAVIK